LQGPRGARITGRAELRIWAGPRVRVGLKGRIWARSGPGFGFESVM